MKDMQQFYERRYAGNYMEECHWLELFKVSQTLDEIGDINGDILDYGCGRGRWSGLLAQKYPSARITGIDISGKAIEKAGLSNPQHKFHVFNGENAPFEDGSFDLVFSFHVLEHVPDIKATVSDISRLVKKGGYLCVIFPCGNENSFEERIVRMIKGGRQTTADGGERFFYEDAGHLRRMESKEIAGLFEQFGLRLYKGYFSNQFIGAIEWISRSSLSLVKELFNTSMAVSISAWIKLMILKLLFFTLVLRNQPVRFMDKSYYKKVLLVMLVPIKVVMMCFGKIIEWFSYLEWHFNKNAQNGSEQFLIFRK